MNRSKDTTLVLLAMPEGVLMDVVLGALTDAARRIDQGCAAPSDAATVTLCRGIAHAIATVQADRRESTRKMIADAMEPAAA